MRIIKKQVADITFYGNIRDLFYIAVRTNNRNRSYAFFCAQN